jgi:predicted  nucleic acid-binding Zn-ribbon protein
MDQEFTTEQKEQLKTWAEQRDFISSEILILRAENEHLQKVNRELAESNTSIVAKMNDVRGRIDELVAKENELPSMMLREVASLQSTKATLEAEVASLSKIIEGLTTQKTSLETDVSFALSTFEAVKAETFMLDKVVDKVTQVSAENTAKIDLLVNNLATSLEEIIAVNRKNVAETNVVIEKLPAMIMEAQRHGLIKNKI